MGAKGTLLQRDLSVNAWGSLRVSGLLGPQGHMKRDEHKVQIQDTLEWHWTCMLCLSPSCAIAPPPPGRLPAAASIAWRWRWTPAVLLSAWRCSHSAPPAPPPSAWWWWRRWNHGSMNQWQWRSQQFCIVAPVILQLMKLVFLTLLFMCFRDMSQDAMGLRCFRPLSSDKE